ncbi:hypothetical protein JYU14_05175, partial [Simkania negevensis]|nr:hypothetical protein [Simkania negevensis]
PPDLLDHLIKKHGERGSVKFAYYELFDSSELVRQACNKEYKNFFALFDLLLQDPANSGVDGQRSVARYFLARKKQEQKQERPSKGKSYDDFLNAALIYYKERGFPDFVVDALKERLSEVEKKLGKYSAAATLPKSLEQEIDSLRLFVDSIRQEEKRSAKRAEVASLMASLNALIIWNECSKETLPKQQKILNERLASLDVRTAIGAKAAAALVVFCYKQKPAISRPEGKQLISLAAKHEALTHSEIVALSLAKAEIQDGDILLETVAILSSKITSGYFVEQYHLLQPCSVVVKKVCESLLNSPSPEQLQPFSAWIEKVVSVHSSDFGSPLILNALFACVCVRKQHIKNDAQAKTNNGHDLTPKEVALCQGFDKGAFADLIHSQTERQQEWTDEKIAAVDDLFGVFSKSLSKSSSFVQKCDVVITAFCLFLKIIRQRNVNETQEKDLLKLGNSINTIFSAISPQKIPPEQVEARKFFECLTGFLAFAKHNPAVLSQPLAAMIVVLVNDCFPETADQTNSLVDSLRQNSNSTCSLVSDLMDLCFVKLWKPSDIQDISSDFDEYYCFVPGLLMTRLFTLLPVDNPRNTRQITSMKPYARKFSAGLERSMSECADLKLSTLSEEGQEIIGFDLVLQSWKTMLVFRYALARINNERGDSLTRILQLHKDLVRFTVQLFNKCLEQKSKERLRTAEVLSLFWEYFCCNSLSEESNNSLFSEDEKATLYADLCSLLPRQSSFSGFRVLHSLFAAYYRRKQPDSFLYLFKKSLNNDLEKTPQEELDKLFSEYFRFLVCIFYKYPDLSEDKDYQNATTFFCERFIAKKIELDTLFPASSHTMDLAAESPPLLLKELKLRYRDYGTFEEMSDDRKAAVSQMRAYFYAFFNQMCSKACLQLIVNKCGSSSSTSEFVFDEEYRQQLVVVLAQFKKRMIKHLACQNRINSFTVHRFQIRCPLFLICINVSVELESSLEAIRSLR